MKITKIISAIFNRFVWGVRLLLNVVFNLLDGFFEKRKDYWIFPVYFLGDGDLSDNSLALFEGVKNNHDIQKIVLFRNKKLSLGNSKSVKQVKMTSLVAYWYLLKSKKIIIQHSISYEFKSIKLRFTHPEYRNIVNLWHGIIIKDLSNPEVGFMNKELEKEMKHHSIIASSTDNKEILKKVFFNTPDENFWETGLPRNDFLKLEDKNLPDELKKELSLLRVIKGDKKLIMYAPTYKDSTVGGYYYNFTNEELSILKKFLKDNNYLLGIRYHPFNPPIDIFKKIIDNEYIIDLSTSMISNMNILTRESDILISDYSSTYIDALYLNKTVISFAYDYDHYVNSQHGFVYDLKDVFPGEICYSFNDLIKTLQNSNYPSSESVDERYKDIYKLFFKYNDFNNTQRVLSKINEL